MKASTGTYFNYFSENGYDNNGFKENLDIFIIFPEYTSVDVLNFNEVERIVTKILTDYTSTGGYSKVEKMGAGKDIVLVESIRLLVGNLLPMEYSKIEKNVFDQVQVIVNII